MNGTDLFTSPPKQPPKVQVGHPPLPSLRDVPEERILEIYGPPTRYVRTKHIICRRIFILAICDQAFRKTSSETR
jgi:hypothetical protein